jgi:hypothetical protein
MADGSDKDPDEKWFLLDAILQHQNGSLGSSAAVLAGTDLATVRGAFMDSLIQQHSAAGWGIRAISGSEIADLIITRRPMVTITGPFNPDLVASAAPAETKTG